MLATNVAETSLTVPGIRFVVDPGLARIKRYSYRSKVEQLQIERISQAAAKQRAGRCGRVASGICIRLYDEEDFGRRPAFTEPEMLRSSLASVILRMKALGLVAVEEFPFVDPPAPRAITDGYALLAELGAVDERHDLTEIGRKLARLPVDPRIGRMVLAAKEEGCLAEVLVIAAALSVQDPRERPLERAQAADEAQKKFADEKSDFLGFLKLWRFFEEGLHHESNRKLHKACREHFLSFNRMREWRDIHSQLKELVAELGWKVGDIVADAGQYARVHRALLTGLLGNIGLKTEEGNYLGARGHQVLDSPRIGARQEGAALDRRCRADRNDAPFRPHGRRDRARMAGTARRTFAEALSERAALGEKAGRRGGAGARDALRPSSLRQPACPVRADRPGRVAEDLHPPGARRGRLGNPRAVLRAQPHAWCARSRRSSTSRAARTCWWTTS